MPHKFKIRKSKEIVDALRSLGFSSVSQKGSHMKFVYNNKHLTVPNHVEISIGTLNTIFKEAGKITEKYSEVHALFLK
mgnify:CR=1 FL=1